MNERYFIFYDKGDKDCSALTFIEYAIRNTHTNGVSSMAANIIRQYIGDKADKAYKIYKSIGVEILTKEQYESLIKVVEEDG